MAKRRIDPADGTVALAAWRKNPTAPDRKTLATAVRFTLEELGERAPGNSVEVRVPPFGVTQCIAGPRHTRGTPPNVVETDAGTWLRLVTGDGTWSQELSAGGVQASGTRVAEIAQVLPLFSGPLGGQDA